MKAILPILLLISLTSCIFRRDFKKGTFVYDTNGALPILIPSDYIGDSITTDSAGNKVRRFKYSNGASFYIARLVDSATVQPIDREMNIPKMYPQGVWLYKGIDTGRLFWRESQLNHFRFGYRNVPAEWEVKFDSAVNYASFQKLR